MKRVVPQEHILFYNEMSWKKYKERFRKFSAAGRAILRKIHFYSCSFL